MAVAVPQINPDGESVRRRMRNPVSASSNLAAQAGATNQAATIALAADPSSPIIIEQVELSYAAAPAGGNLQISGASSGKVKDLDITQAGMSFLTFNPPLVFQTNEAVTITLAAGNTTGATGKVSCGAWKMQ